MIRADRELLADLARMNSDVVPLAMKIMGDSAAVEEQRTFASRLVELGTRLNHRARLPILGSGREQNVDGDEDGEQCWPAQELPDQINGERSERAVAPRPHRPRPGPPWASYPR